MWLTFLGAGHESIISLSAGHLCMSYFSWAPSVRYPDGRVSGDENETWVTYTSHLLLDILTVQRLNAKGRIYTTVKCCSVFLETADLFPRISCSNHWTENQFFYSSKKAAACVCLVWKCSIPNVSCMKFLWVYFLFGECFVFHWFVEKAWVF